MKHKINKIDEFNTKNTKKLRNFNYFFANGGFMKEKIEGEQPQSFDGSPYGKFEDVESLRNAYENLEKEFTRKSQLLSDFQKKANETSLDSQKEEEKSLTEVENLSEENKIDNSLPFWQREDWNQQVANFLKDNPLAKNHAKELSKMILEDKALVQNERPLYVAWAKWLEANYKTPEQLLEDENFLKQVQKNDKVVNAVIKDYLLKLNNRENTPPIFASSDFGVSTKVTNRPKTLEEVKEMARKIFNK